MIRGANSLPSADRTLEDHCHPIPPVPHAVRFREHLPKSGHNTIQRAASVAEA
jgi:hypothetical protein